MNEILSPVVHGRSRGSCTLCCKVMRIDAFEKPQGKWCKECNAGQGCKIYDSKPEECQTFYCGWLTEEQLGPEWKPTVSKFVISLEGNGNRLAINVDHGFPTKWREEPYYSWIKQMGVDLTELSQQVVVYVKDRVFVILPGKDADLGRMKSGDAIFTGRLADNSWEAILVPEEEIGENERDSWFSAKRLAKRPR